MARGPSSFGAYREWEAAQRAQLRAREQAARKEERERAAREGRERDEDAEARTLAVEQRVTEVEGLLRSSLARDPRVSLDSLQVPTDVEAQRLELQEAIATARHSATLAVQISGFLVAADSLLLAYGFAQRQSGIFLVASLLPLAILAISIVILKSMIPVGYVAMTLERELGLRTAPFATIFTMRVILGTQPSDLRSDIINMDLQNLLFSTSSARTVLTSRPSYILYLFFALQFALFLIATFAYNFRFM